MLAWRSVYFENVFSTSYFLRTPFLFYFAIFEFSDFPITVFFVFLPIFFYFLFRFLHLPVSPFFQIIISFSANSLFCLLHLVAILFLHSFLSRLFFLLFHRHFCSPYISVLLFIYFSSYFSCLLFSSSSFYFSVIRSSPRVSVRCQLASSSPVTEVRVGASSQICIITVKPLPC